MLSHAAEIKYLVKKYNPKIFTIQESHLRPYHSYNLQGYNSFRFDFQDANRLSGRTTIFVDNFLTPTNITLTNTNFQANAVSIKTQQLHNTPLTICNIYIPPYQTITTDELEEFFQTLPKLFIVTGDFNTHSPFWGSTTTNNRGNAMNKFLSKNYVFLLNNGSSTHFSTSKRILR